MYKVGDKLAHPSYGAGVLKGVEKVANHFEIGGPKLEYYVLEMLMNGEKIMVPVENADTVGIRPVIMREEVDRVMEILHSEPDMKEENWSARHHDNLEKVRTGDIFLLAEVIRDLYSRNMVKSLSSRERKMLLNAKRILLSELSMVMDEDYRELEEKLRSSFSVEIDDT